MQVTLALWMVWAAFFVVHMVDFAKLEKAALFVDIAPSFFLYSSIHYTMASGYGAAMLTYVLVYMCVFMYYVLCLCMLYSICGVVLC